jgi:hypothetical protein
VRTIYQLRWRRPVPERGGKGRESAFVFRGEKPFADGTSALRPLFVGFWTGIGVYHPDGYRRLADIALVALTLLVAESKPEDKATMVTLVVNLINQDSN